MPDSPQVATRIPLTELKKASAELEAVIEPKHLTPEAVRQYREQFEAHPSRLIVLSSFLQQEQTRQIHAFLQGEAAFEQVYGLYSTNGPVTEEAFLAAKEKDRFYTYGIADRPSDPRRISLTLLSYLKIRSMLESEAFQGYAEAVTGCRLGYLLRESIHAMKSQDFLKPHTDRGMRQRIAINIYLSPGWTSEMGGALHVHGLNGELSVVEPVHNSIIFFDVAAHKEHHVQPITAAAGDRTRFSFGGWFVEPEA